MRVDDRSADVQLGLPDHEESALRILDDGHPPDVHHVERRRDHVGAQLLGAICRLVRALHRDVGVPRGRRAVLALHLVLQGDPGDRLAADVHHRVRHAVPDRLVVGIPSEQLAVVLLGPVLIGGGEVCPGESARCVFGSFGHAGDPTWTGRVACEESATRGPNLTAGAGPYRASNGASAAAMPARSRSAPRQASSAIRAAAADRNGAQIAPLARRSRSAPSKP